MSATAAETDHRNAARVYLQWKVFQQALTRRGITTIAAAADLLDVDPGTIHRFRGGRIKQPSGDLMLRWAAKLDVAVEDLWRRSDPPPDDTPPPSPPPAPPKPPGGPNNPRPPSGPKAARHG